MSFGVSNHFIASSSQVASGLLAYNVLADVTTTTPANLFNIITGMASGYKILDLDIYYEKDANAENVGIIFNGDTANNHYSWDYVQGATGTLSGSSSTAVPYAFLTAAIANSQGFIHIRIYNNTLYYKHYVASAGNDTTAQVTEVWGDWHFNTEVTQIDFKCATNNFNKVHAILYGSQG